MNIKIGMIILVFLGIAGFFAGQLFLSDSRVNKQLLQQRYDKNINHYPEIIEVITEKNNSQKNPLVSRKNAIVNAIDRASPAVVSITVKKARNLSGRNLFFEDPFFDLFLSQKRKSLVESFSSVGSGVIVDVNGYIVTNSHVVGTSRGETRLEIKVSLANKNQYEGQVIGIDQDNDIAVIKIEGKNLPAATLQEQAENFIGEWVIAIGNPFGFLMGDSKPTVTVGVISALNRNFSVSSGIGYNNMIQTDASINPGNSGGALVNAQGEVIGINTFIISGQNSSIGLGFAIPIQKAIRVVEELVEYGYIRQWTTGIFTNPYSGGSHNRPGIHISGVEKRLPGDKAGLKKGDIIIKVAGRKINTIHDFMEILRKYQVGESVSVDFLRNNKQKSTTMILEEHKNEN